MTGRKTELERIAVVAARFAGANANVRTAIGDDAAVLALSNGAHAAGPLVWTIDAQVEGTHFRLDWLSWHDVGWRSFMAASSDLAAMGAQPIAALSSLALVDTVDDAAFDALTRGQAEASLAVGAPIVGGNLARAKETSVTTTVLGHAERPVLRSGAHAGDGLFLAGSIGMAAAGLAALQRGVNVQDASIDACIQTWRRPRALIEMGKAMSSHATAAIDVSDGLARDALHIAAASGVTLVLSEVALRSHAGGALTAASALLGRDVVDLILEGGEDYALLVTSPLPIDGFVRIGDVEVGPASLSLQREDGTRRAVDTRGFDHFA